MPIATRQAIVARAPAIDVKIANDAVVHFHCAFVQASSSYQAPATAKLAAVSSKTTVVVPRTARTSPRIEATASSDGERHLLCPQSLLRFFSPSEKTRRKRCDAHGRFRGTAPMGFRTRAGRG